MTWESSPQRNTGAYGGRGRGSPQPNNGNGGGSSYGGGGGNGNYGSGSGGGGYGGGSNYGGGGSYGSGGPDRGSGGYDNRRNNQGDASQSQSRGAGQGEPPKGPHQWASSRRRYEWKDEYNDEGIAPRDEDLEKELFGEESHVHSGINFTKYESIKVHVKGEGPPPITSVSDRSLSDSPPPSLIWRLATENFSVWSVRRLELMELSATFRDSPNSVSIF
ncbi:hypothetical protein BC936DRAFT_141288 [Jimgerdemannia flammicorona]|uniref:Uncharacterized protein n=2 Tax=Jimgerdemannia flammicorona TaxID=994334 RepID=A0A433A2L2_9FUNG|nr:hypothetical protein BC936DRAFT_141288 [Jimgerdemannia flammicorona]RUS25065.1 hypothetical protein BC938DRAFT_472677 [Jimgerdemannia flammicorona]